MSSPESRFHPALRQELPYLVDALGQDYPFLHDRRQFELLGEIATDSHRHGDPLASFLVAGCDRGVDAYSLCLTLLEAMRQRPHLPFSILGTDLLPANLEMAVRAVYPTAAITGLPASLVRRYFLRSRDPQAAQVRLRPGVRGRVRFRCQDIFGPFALREPMDVIVCRQILHHFHPRLARQLAVRLRQLLAPGGLLVLGVPLPRIRGLRHLEAAIYQAM